MTETELKNYIAAIRPADRDAMAAARQRQAQLAKPPGSLGALEDMSVKKKKTLLNLALILRDYIPD